MLGVDLWTCGQRSWRLGTRRASRRQIREGTPGRTQDRPPIGGFREARGCGSTRSPSGDALVTVMEPADLGNSADPAAAGRRLDVSGDGAVVLERLMGT
jgi:hypothetical protein